MLTIQGERQWDDHHGSPSELITTFSGCDTGKLFAVVNDTLFNRKVHAGNGLESAMVPIDRHSSEGMQISQQLWYHSDARKVAGFIPPRGIISPRVMAVLFQ
jgi:hypothetical protein